MRQNSKMITLAIIVIGITISLSAVADEQHKVESPMIADQPISRDSIYKLINNEYLEIKQIFANSCFDCHSNQTVYPWYHSMPLIGGMLDDHIENGRKNLDLSYDFPFGTMSSQLSILYEIREEIEEGEMPLLGYRLLHWGSKIEGAQKDSVFNWISNSIKLLELTEQKTVHNHDDH